MNNKSSTDRKQALLLPLVVKVTYYHSELFIDHRPKLGLYKGQQCIKKSASVVLICNRFIFYPRNPNKLCKMVPNSRSVKCAGRTFAAHALSPHCEHTRLNQTGRSSLQPPGHHGNQESGTPPKSEGSLIKIIKDKGYSFPSAN